MDNDNISTANSAARPPLYKRRGFLATAGLSAATLTTAGLLTQEHHDAWRARFNLGGPIDNLENAFLKRQAAFKKQYLNSGELPGGPSSANELLAQKEYIEFLHRHHDIEPKSFRDYWNTDHATLTHDIEKSYQASLQNSKQKVLDLEEQYSSPTVSRIANLKLALHEVLERRFANPAKITQWQKQYPEFQETSGMNYWKTANLVVDPVLTPFMQCRSGTKIMTSLALKNISKHLQEGERLVQVHSKPVKDEVPHVQLGLLLPDNHLIRFEMTVKGIGIQDKGKLDENYPEEVLVTDAAHEMAQSVIDEKAFEDKTIIFDNRSAENKSAPVQFGVPNFFSKSLDQYGMGGKAEDNLPDKPNLMGELDRFSDSSSGGGVYDSLKEAPSEEKLLARLPAADRAMVQDYLRSSVQLDAYWNEHIEIANSYIDGDLDREQYEKATQAFIERFVDFIKANNLEQKYQTATALLEKQGVGFTTKGPAQRARSMAHNFNVAFNRR